MLFCMGRALEISETQLKRRSESLATEKSRKQKNALSSKMHHQSLWFSEEGASSPWRF
jgi:hypothetical protein